MKLPHKLIPALLIAASSPTLQVYSQTIDSLNPGGSGASGSIYALALQSDGKILLGGSFGLLGGQTRTNLGRLNADGTLDTNFTTGASATIYSLALQSDGRVLIGGQFALLGGQYRTNIARINGDDTLDGAFNPGANGQVNSVIAQPDGKILVGGLFTSLGGQTHNRLGRLNADGSLDTNFTAAANGAVNCVALQPDGRILVAGSFSNLVGQARTNLGRLNTDGSLDTNFTAGANGSIYAVAVQPDAKILVGGSFTTAGGQLRTNIARFNTDGSLDTNFTASADGVVYSLVLQANGSILVGGGFASLGGQARNYIGRLNGDGTLDTNFNAGASSGGGIFSLALQTDGKILAGGSFTQLAGQSRNRIGRLNNTDSASETLSFDGSSIIWLRGGAGPEVWRTRFDASTNGNDWISLGEGTRISGGWELTGLGLPANATIRARGYVIGGYQNSSSWILESSIGPPVITSQPASRSQLPGDSVTFSVTAVGAATLTYQWLQNGIVLSNVANVSGALTATLALTNVSFGDASGYSVIVSNAFGSVTSVVALLKVVNFATADALNPGANGAGVLALAVQPDGKILVGGNFSTFAGQPRGELARLNADGTLDSDFNPTASGGGPDGVYSLAVQTDGRILVAGEFTSLNGQTRNYNYLGRLNGDGTLDSAFAPVANNIVETLLLQEDGKIVLGGWFSSLAGQTRYLVGRLNGSDTLDTNFNAGLNYGTPGVFSMAMQPDGKVLVGGGFTMGGGQAPNHNLGRLNTNGTLDTAFNPGVNDYVNSLAIQADGKILVGGSFTVLGGQLRSHIGRLNSDGTVDTSFNPGANGSIVWCLAIQADGKILVGGNFTTLGGQPRNRIGRLNSDGTVDNTFNPGANGTVYSVALQADGKILVGGTFATLAGQSRTNFGRLNNTEGATENLAFDGSTITWLRGGTSPEVWRTTFDASTNGTDWSSLGAGVRIGGGWQLSNVTVSANSLIRARGFAAGGYDNDSSWFVESLLQLGPQLIAAGVRSNHFGFDINTRPNQAVVIEASSNLAAWSPIQTNLANNVGLIIFTDMQSGLFPRRFYRVRLFEGVLPPPTIRSSDGSMGFQAGQFGFNLAGVAGQTVVIETSTNLVNWSALGTNTLGAAPLYFTDPGSINYSWRFYRARLQ